MIDDILVLGGTGFVGRSVCEKLVERSGGAGGSIVVPTRHIAHARDLQMLPTLQPVQADVHDDAQLAQMVAGRDAVINLVAVLQGDERRFRHVHVDLPTRLARACQAAGVKRLVHVSALGVGANAPSHYLRSKAAGEAALAAAGLELTVLRPSVIFGAHDKLLNMFAALQGLAPFVPLAGADSRYQPVWVDDVAAAIVRCLDDPATIGKTYECTGPDVYTLRELVQAAGRWAGHERPVFGLPGGLAQLQARVMEMLPGEPLMSRDNLA
ncbi:MAG TPA: complex I NDUFA9 subunit family protein, partial [Piscinibacter sp.]|nr:complex I NDUFA9 subunit family protein [Piscinibacter sp.]